jgi:hypothetical protein
MSTDATLSPSNLDEMVAKLNKRLKRLSIFAIVLAIAVLVIATVGFFMFHLKVKAIEQGQKDIAFNQFTAEWSNGQDFVQPTVNTIQFMRHGYSITFDKVEYNQNGLLLSGQVGNPTHLWISSLALDFTARPYPYKVRDKWEKDNASGLGPWLWWSDSWDIGKAQTSVGALNPGSTAFFEVTIPNVKQTSDNIQIAVVFSGERYQYLGR